MVARRGAAAADVGRSRGAEPRLCEARDAGSLPVAPRARACGLPLRAARERRGDTRLRRDRHAADDLVPLAHLLSSARRAESLRVNRRGEPRGRAQSAQSAQFICSAADKQFISTVSSNLTQLGYWSDALV